VAAFSPIAEEFWRAQLEGAGVLQDSSGLLIAVRETAPPGIRPLTADDLEAFALFQATASEQDVDDADVELDHWVVAGAFSGDRLVCAASAYPWGDSLVADIGVVTLPDQRGRGLARAVVRELSRCVLARGLEPQYRTQLTHTASRAGAAGAGLRWFGDWDAIASGA
jgi:predicted GNAT family acetyltransferase